MRPPKPVRSLRYADEQTTWTLTGLGAGAVLVAYFFVRRHPLVALGGLVVAVALAVLALRLQTSWRDRRAATQDPPGPGIVIGTVRGSWRGARRRRFYLPWASFQQHVGIFGPTGRGKTWGFVVPILCGFVSQPASRTGVMQLDGKGDPLHLDDPQTGEPGVPFDHVFCPAEPGRSACWNPLAGPDPVEAANLFAAALFPTDDQAPGAFYAEKAVHVLKQVIPAMAYTGHATTPNASPAGVPSAAKDPRELVARLTGLGVDEDHAKVLVNKLPAEHVAGRLKALAAGELAGLNADALLEAIRAENAPEGPSPATRSPRVHEVTPAALTDVLFADDGLAQLAEAVGAHVSANKVEDGQRAYLLRLQRSLEQLARAGAREHAAVLQSLQNKLGVFLEPPFLELCSRSDFQIADVCEGARLSMLLPIGRFPTGAAVLGRVALSQFKNAVLSSDPRAGRRKVLVADEFGAFVSFDFGAFLAQARSFGGCGVIATQSIHDLPREHAESMLQNLSTAIVCPGCRPDDAQYWADAFGKQLRPHESYSWEASSPLAPSAPTVRVEEVEEYRYSPSEIADLAPGTALIKLTHGLRSFPVAHVSVRRTPRVAR